MLRGIFVLLSLCVIGFAEEKRSVEDWQAAVTDSSDWKKQVEEIDKAIDKLTNLRNLELAKASRKQNQADRLQFNPNNLQDARRYWNEADTSREIAARYQEEIDKLEIKKQEILNAHGVEYTPKIEPKQHIQ